jgi:hypothetical protein
MEGGELGKLSVICLSSSIFGMNTELKIDLTITFSSNAIQFSVFASFSMVDLLDPLTTI